VGAASRDVPGYDAHDATSYTAGYGIGNRADNSRYIFISAGSRVYICRHICICRRTCDCTCICSRTGDGASCITGCTSDRGAAFITGGGAGGNPDNPGKSGSSPDGSTGNDAYDAISYVAVYGIGYLTGYVADSPGFGANSGASRHIWAVAHDGTKQSTREDTGSADRHDTCDDTEFDFINDAGEIGGTGGNDNHVTDTSGYDRADAAAVARFSASKGTGAGGSDNIDTICDSGNGSNTSPSPSAADSASACSSPSPGTGSHASRATAVTGASGCAAGYRASDDAHPAA
jgi:hypothetical protein